MENIINTINKIKVEVFNQDGKWWAQSEIASPIWSTGSTIDEAITNFKSQYKVLLEIPFQGGNIEWDFHVKM